MYQAFMYLNTCVSFHLRLQMLKSLNEAYNTVLCFWISVFHFSISFSKISRRPSSVLFWNTFPAWKVSKYEVFPGPYFPVFSRNKQNTDQKILRIRILFTQWFPHLLYSGQMLLSFKNATEKYHSRLFFSFTS